MAKESFGIIDDDRTYTAEQLAGILGKSERSVRDFVRQNVRYAEPFEGLILVSGRLFRMAIEGLSAFDTAEKAEKRRRSSGAATRAKRSKVEE